MPFEYPKHPNAGRRDPSRDERGINPFADDAQEDPASDNPYDAPQQAPGVTYQPADFESTYPHRGGRILILGRIGLVLSILGAAGVTTSYVLPESAWLWLVLATALLLLGLAHSATAWIMGRHDLPALRCGAMDQAGLAATRHGHRLGLLGTLIAIAPVIAALVMLVRSIADEL
jgi:hypothetical protein